MQAAFIGQREIGSHFVRDDGDDLIPVHAVGERLQTGVAAHPVQVIENLQVHWRAVTNQGLFTRRVEKVLEVRHDQFAQAAENWLAVAQASEIGLRHCAPVRIFLEERQEVIVVALVGDEFKDQRWIAYEAQRHGGKQRPVEAVRLPFAQDA